MDKNETINSRIKEISRAPARPATGLKSLIIDQDWLWRVLGLVTGFVIAMVIAVLTLSPLHGGLTVSNGLDKVYHFVAFALLIFPLIATDSRRWYWAVPLAILYGGVIELIQPSMGRHADWLDFGADLSGVLAGAALAEILHDRIYASMFDTDHQKMSQEDDEQEEQRIEEIRAALMDELRAVLREELAAAKPLDTTRPVGPFPIDRSNAKHPSTMSMPPISRQSELRTRQGLLQ